MPLPYVKNPMYALCLLAAVCVRQHVHNSRYDFSLPIRKPNTRRERVKQPLTKGMTLQTPTSVVTKPNEASLKTINANKKISSEKLTENPKAVQVEEADSLVKCVQKFAKHARRIVDDFKSSIPVSKSTEYVDLFTSSSILDSLLYLTSYGGIKWMT
ncbi:uncharacterized protein LOC113464476 [Ceratina calcarata]|uniref:Uncharacterized protein LOC113464476 n=1 Tax=Ceratina calcarata TaxID=156304 RepID=A0AAJ7S2M0_9HYME|nr:uncharacterized protein LOC113464476 [Ceratina calcarata]